MSVPPARSASTPQGDDVGPTTDAVLCALASLPEAAFVQSADGRYAFVTASYAALLRRSVDEIVGRRDAEFSSPAAASRADDARRRALAEPGVPARSRASLSDDLGGVVEIETTRTALVPRPGDAAFVLGVANVVTRASRLAFDDAHPSHGLAEDGAPRAQFALRFWPKGDDEIVYASASFRRVAGLALDARLERIADLMALVHPGDLERVREALRAGCATLTPWDVEFRTLQGGRGERWIEARSVPELELEGTTLVRGVAIDVTARKAAELEAHASRARYVALFEHLEAAVVHARIEYVDGVPVDWTYVTTNAAYERMTGIRDAVGRRVSEAFPGLLDRDPEVLARYARVAETGEPAAAEVFVRSLGRWLSTVAYRPAPGEFLAMLTDVSERKRAEDEARALAARLERSVFASVAAVSRMVEVRDPYTAGHEERVAALAVAIAEELGLDDEARKGLRVAALLHDIGKIGVPAEVLVKPSKLSAPEYALVKMHVDTGYEILQSIDFPWPVADIVRQHHERLDGSGYPFALRGDAIRLEARILGVADTVEAMSSHRPYRAALGIEKAVDEITRGADAGYDAAVVAACVRVFETRSGEFAWPGAEKLAPSRRG